MKNIKKQKTIKQKVSDLKIFDEAGTKKNTKMPKYRKFQKHNIYKYLEEE